MEYKVSIENNNNTNGLRKTSIYNTNQIQKKLNHMDSSDEEWKRLAQSLYKASIKANLENENCLFLHNGIIVEWIGKTEKCLTHNNFRSNDDMKNYSEWEKCFINRLISESNVKEILLLDENDDLKIWVIIDEANILNIKRFSEIYINFLSENENLNFEFLVFEENDIDENDLMHFRNVRRVKGN